MSGLHRLSFGEVEYERNPATALLALRSRRNEERCQYMVLEEHWNKKPFLRWVAHYLWKLSVLCL